MEIKETIVRTANSFIGQEEIRGNLGFKDEQFEEMMKAVGWRRTQAWCAYFSELVWKLAYVNSPEVVSQLDQLFNASAVKTWHNFKDSEFTNDQIPVKGSLAVWQKYKNGEPHWTGHIAIVTDYQEGRQSFKSVEGNTNSDGSREGYAVAEKVRNMNFHSQSGLRLLGFIHPKEISNA